MNFDRNSMNEGSPGMSISPGETVYDVNGDKVGTVQEYNPQANCLVVEKGFFFPKDVYIPMSAVQHNTSDGINVSMTKDELKDDRYSSPPEPDRADNARATEATDYYNKPDSADQLGGMQGQRTTTNDGDIAVPVREEELIAEKRRGEVGRVRVHKDTVEQQQAINVPVHEEQVQVERVPVDKDLPADQANAQNWQGQGQDVVLPVMGEDVTVEKRPRVKEEIRIHKQPVTETERVADTVRKERVEIEGVDDQGNPVDRNARQNMDQQTDNNP